MPRPPIVRTVSFALLVTIAGAACKGAALPVETGIFPARAVAPSTVAHGATIRFVLRTDSLPTVGHLSRLTADSLIIERCANCDRLRYGTREINRLEVRRGSSRGRRFGHGLVFGALAGLAIAVFDNAQPCHALDTDVCGFRVLEFFVGPPFGALIGGIVGVALPTGERWEPVAAQQRSARLPHSTS
jgi:hypothetical protein